MKDTDRLQADAPGYICAFAGQPSHCLMLPTSAIHVPLETASIPLPRMPYNSQSGCPKI